MTAWQSSAWRADSPRLSDAFQIKSLRGLNHQRQTASRCGLLHMAAINPDAANMQWGKDAFVFSQPVALFKQDQSPVRCQQGPEQ